MFSCTECDKLLPSKRALNDHRRKKHQSGTNSAIKTFLCGDCDSWFTTTSNLLRHIRNQHDSSNPYRCFSCPTYFGKRSAWIDHNEVFHTEKIVNTNALAVSDLLDFSTEAVSAKFQIHRLELESDRVLEPFNYLISHKEKLIGFVNTLLHTTPNVKLGINISIKLEKPLTNDVTEAYFNSTMSRLSCIFTDEEFMKHIDALMSQLNVFATGGSGWVVQSLNQLEIKTVTCGNITGTSFIETPAILKPLKRTILNVVNKRDNFCFLYCIAAALFAFTGRATSPKSHQKNIQRLHFNSKLMPMPLTSIPSFEKRNKCSINVYQLENSKLLSVYHSKNRGARNRVDLLRLVENRNSHYCLIKNFSNLVHFLTRSKIKQRKGPKSRFCRNCFQPILKQNFKKHVLFCETNAPLEIRMPIGATHVEFVQWEKTQKCPFVVYADLESINVASTGAKVGRTREVGKQYPASFGAVLIDSRS